MANVMTFDEETGSWVFNTVDTPLLIDSDVIFLDTLSGVVLKAPAGGYWKVTIDDSGNLITTSFSL